MAYRRTLWREQMLKYLLICLPQFYLFPSLPVALPSRLQRPRNTSSATRRQRQQERQKIHNIKLLFSICCTQRFHLCKQKMRGASVGWRLKMWGRKKHGNVDSSWNSSFGIDWVVRQVGRSARFGAGICFTELLTGNTDAAFFPLFCSVQRKLCKTTGYWGRSSHGNNALSNYNYKSNKVSGVSADFDMDEVAFCPGQHGLREARRGRNTVDKFSPNWYVCLDWITFL